MHNAETTGVTAVFTPLPARRYPAAPAAPAAPEAPATKPIPPATRPKNFVKVFAGAADLVAIAIAMGAAWAIRPNLPGAMHFSHGQHLLVGIGSLPVWLLIFSHYRLYTARAIATRLEEFRRLVHAVGASAFGMAVAAYMFKVNIARGWVALTFVFALALVTVEREVARRIFNRMRRNGRLLRPVVIVGANAEGFALVDELMNDRTLGYTVVGVVDEDIVAAECLVPHRVTTGTINQTLDAVRRSGACGVIIATTAVDFSTMNRLARDLTEVGIHVELSSSLRDIHVERLTSRQLGRFPVTYVEPVSRRGWRHAAKRALDVFGSSLVLVFTSPVLAACAIAIKLDTRGPVFFRQDRIGQNGQPFKILKFRTMIVNAEALLYDLSDRNEADGPLFKIKDDPRITRVGRILRKLSLDELPQLWNVVGNEMSLVGPRPSLPNEVEAFSDELNNRMRVKPGMTGMWQVSGRSDSSFETFARHDLYYVDNWSLWTDLAIIGKTIPTVLFSRGAY